MSNVLIVDYGLCNVDSVVRAVQECGGQPCLSEDPADAATADHIVLPGVGNFAEAMKALRKRGWDKALRQDVLETGTPLLGICLGMQLLASWGDEGGGTEGLGIIDGKVVRFEKTSDSMRIPHVGWNEVDQQAAEPVFSEIANHKDFYFVHSYHFVPAEAQSVLATTPYGDCFASVIGRENIVGTQFHPEKSLRIGFQLLRNFLRLY